MRKNSPTVVQIFEGYMPATSLSTSPVAVTIDDVILRSVGPSYKSKLDLIPCRLELCNTLRNPASKDRKLAKALAKVSEHYDLVVIDCAPTDSMLTDAAYFASRYLIVPVKPEFMAAIGLPLLARSLTTFKHENEDHAIDIAGVVFVHSSSYSRGPEGRMSIADVTKVAAKEGWNVFSNSLPYSASYPRSAREGKPLAWTSNAQFPTKAAFENFRKEVFMVLGLSAPSK